MGDLMRPVSFKELVDRMFNEYRKDRKIFGIAESQFFKKEVEEKLSIFGESCETALGPAAGPHTQLTQNIVASYLVGGRFIELKTVQILDELEIDKPCIDARDEGYNTEWSSEFTLQKAYDEYVKAWVILYMFEELFDLNSGSDRSFIFNMSVGYNLEGIKNPRVDKFINDLIDSSGNEVFQSCLKELDSLAADGTFLNGTGLESKLDKLKGLSAKIPAQLCSQITLSTMHGCPPKEIEAICNYMLSEKKLNTFVKLNPTLLGFDMVREILDNLGFDYLKLTQESFDHDLQYADAIGMLNRLVALSKKEGLNFGVKLTNTLGSVNDQGVLPGNDMYMSGRALFPLSINLAAKLSRDFNGELPISYSGGASQYNVEKIFAAGIRPITLATEMLQPGGYLRMAEMAKLLEKSSAWKMDKIDIEALEALAKESLDAKYASKAWRGPDKAQLDEDLPLYDCYVAPCKVACPIHQDIPEYIKLVGQKRYAEAIELIYEKNALPAITGHICAHQCMYNCTRLDYEGTVQIREIKKIAVQNGFEDYKKKWQKPVVKSDAKVAVIGAGPAGLSAAYFLSREGYDVTILEKADGPGGVVEYVVPHFRIPREALLSDIEFIKAHGVKFEYGVDPDFSISDLKARGYKYIAIAIGAEGIRAFPIDGDNENIYPSFKFLQDFNTNQDAIHLGKHVAVVGAGDTAMDAARAALRVKGVESVKVLYRRAEEQMPASPEEYVDALAENIPFHWLRNPEKFEADGTLTVRVMELGAPDASGRKRPVPTDKTETMHIDTLIPSIGETVDVEVLKKAGVKLNSKNWFEHDADYQLEDGVFILGDGRTGPSTIVEAIAEGRVVADAICRKEDNSWKREKRYSFLDDLSKESDILEKKGLLIDSIEAADYDMEDYARTEAIRCLECDYICNKCVDVCPNRANVALKIAGFHDQAQIVHLDAYCNECGNCGTFCPYNGNPYLDKLTIFSMDADFENSANPGFYASNGDMKLRFGGQVYNLKVSASGEVSGNAPSGSDWEKTKKVIAGIYSEYSYLLGEVLE